jgi:hypothetical protein
MAALFLSVIVIIVIEYFDQSIKSPAQFNRQTQLPLIGAISYIDKFDGNILSKVNSISKEEGRNNVFKELLRKLRYEIESSGKRIFLFTSTEPQQGKTTLIQALSYSLSLGKKKVLIIDTNFCNNDLTNILHATPSLEKFYVNGKPFNIEDVKALVTPTDVEGVETYWLWSRRLYSFRNIAKESFTELLTRTVNGIRLYIPGRCAVKQFYRYQGVDKL